MGMTQAIDHDSLNAVLQRCGSHWNAAQAHGLLCARLAVSGSDGARVWLHHLIDEKDLSSGISAEDAVVFDGVLATTWAQLAARQSDLELLLPGDGEDTASRAQGLADWSEGFLHGIVADQANEEVRRRLAEEPLADVIKDMLEITRATVGDEDDVEGDENAYVELVEYLRVAAQLAYEELSELRPADPAAADLPGDSTTLH